MARWEWVSPDFASADLAFVSDDFEAKTRHLISIEEQWFVNDSEEPVQVALAGKNRKINKEVN